MTKEIYQAIEKVLQRAKAALQDSERRLIEVEDTMPDGRAKDRLGFNLAKTFYACDISTYESVMQHVLIIIKHELLRENPDTLQDLVSEAREIEDKLDQN